MTSLEPPGPVTVEAAPSRGSPASSSFSTRTLPSRRGLTKVSSAGVLPPGATVTAWSAAVSWPGGVVVSNAQQSPNGTLLIEHSPVPAVVHVRLVTVATHGSVLTIHEAGPVMHRG